MLHSVSRACMFAALCGLLFVPSLAWGQDHRVRHVQDDAGLFTQAARDKANAIVTQIADRHHKEVFIETVKEGPADAGERANWSKTRFNNYKMDGVYIVFSKEPKFFRIEVGNKTREQGYFGVENVRKLEEIIKAKQSADDMLIRVADYTLDTMNMHPPKKAVAPKGRPVNAQQAPVGQHRDQHESAMPGWVGWVCLIVAVLLVVWVIFAIVRAFTGMGGYGYGGYPGYGYGGGFFPGFLGGMFGVMGGMWMYNTFFGGHANYSTGDWGGGAGGAGDAGAAGYDGDTGTGASGGGDDWGGGGDAGGGDWGGDAGGGDVGGGDWGGGDAGGSGCGGGGCGGGGCGGGGD